jgi:hypothetical protein
LIARKFAGGQKTMGSHGQYEKTSIVYLYFMVGIVISSYCGSWMASFLMEHLNSNNFMGISLLSILASVLAYFVMKLGFY